MIEALAFLILGLWVAWLVVPSQAVGARRAIVITQLLLLAVIAWWWLS